MVREEVDHDPHENDPQNVCYDPNDELDQIAVVFVFELSPDEHERENAPEYSEDSH